MVLAALMLQGAMLAASTPAMAQQSPQTQQPANTQSQVCTNFEQRKQEVFGGTSTPNAQQPQNTEPGLLSEIYLYIKDIVSDATKKLFSVFVNNAGYQNAVYWTLVLMVVFYGIGFTIGVVQPSFGQALIRLVKFGIILALISPSGWQFFSDPNTGAGVVAFFNDGTDDLVKGVVAIGTDVKAPPGATPFYQFDKLARFVIQPETFIAVMSSTFAGGPYGMAMGGLMLIAIAGFIGLLVQALRSYAVSYVVRSMLLGLAPIFFIFLLFDRTKNMFMTWLNALISVSLQPILLFTFLSFFMVLIENASKDMLSTEFCWTEYQNVRGSQNSRAFWRALDDQGNPITSQMTWQGTAECIFSGKGDCPEFPINIIDILSFLILVFLAQRFAAVIERIAYELSNAYVSLDAGGRLDMYMQQMGGRGSPLRDILPGNRSAGGGSRQTPPETTPRDRS